MSNKPVQAVIENAMQELGLNEARWESIALFSDDGLLMAACGESPLYDQESLLEFCFSLMNTVNLLGNDQPLQEIIVKAKDHRLLVFRYFHAWDENMILAAVIPGRKGYKRALNRLLAKIYSLS